MLIPTAGPYLTRRVQYGGGLPVYRGQRGAGFGDVLRGFFRRAAPVLLKGASTFFGGMNQARERGTSWKDSAKQALKPTAKKMLKGAYKQLKEEPDEDENQNQEGGGKRRKRFIKHKRLTKHKRHIKHKKHHRGVYKPHRVHSAAFTNF